MGLMTLGNAGVQVKACLKSWGKELKFPGTRSGSGNPLEQLGQFPSVIQWVIVSEDNQRRHDNSS